jgi:hypothetical protein
MVVVAALVFLWRIEAGALVPGTADPHYMLATPLFRWWRNARNYFWRLLPEPLAAVILLSIAGAIGTWANKEPRPNREPGTGNSEPGLREIAVFGIAWVAVCLLPVLPVIARNELYLYLPAFGMSVLAAYTIARLADRSWQRPSTRIALAVFVATAGAYQVSRNREMHDELVFSGKLVEALAGTRGPGVVLLVAEDEATRRFLQDTIAGYLPAVLRQAAPDGRLIAADSDHPDPPGLIRLRCRYHDGRLVFVRN